MDGWMGRGLVLPSPHGCDGYVGSEGYESPIAQSEIYEKVAMTVDF
jgi:hypothetical protein